MSDDKPTELNEVTTVLNRWYYGRIRSDAEDYVKRYHANEFDDAEAMRDDIFQNCDDADIVIYTYQAQLVYAASDNSSDCDQEIEDMGTDKPTAEMRASICYRLDLTEQIEALLGQSIEDTFDAREEKSEEGE